MTREQEQIDSLQDHLMRRWFAWGIMPLLACALLVGALALWGPEGPIEGKQQTRLAFEIVFGVAAAVFLAGFYIDGHWTNRQRVAHKIYEAAGGNEDRNPASWAQSGAHRSALRDNAEIALNSIRASADAITLMGGTIGLVAIVSVLMGLPGAHVVQVLIMGACYQLFIYSRHPHYMELAEEALDGRLIPPKREENEGGLWSKVWRS
ncbi:MAG: hypothetical protein ACOCX2_15140 [Armatimonadota bacterium]